MALPSLWHYSSKSEKSLTKKFIIRRDSDNVLFGEWRAEKLVYDVPRVVIWDSLMWTEE